MTTAIADRGASTESPAGFVKALTLTDATIAVAVSSLIFIVIELWKQFHLRRQPTA